MHKFKLKQGRSTLPSYHHVGGGKYNLKNKIQVLHTFVGCGCADCSSDEYFGFQEIYVNPPFFSCRYCGYKSTTPIYEVVFVGNGYVQVKFNESYGLTVSERIWEKVI